MSQSIKKFDWIDGLRGYAILLVMMIHTGQQFLGESFHLEAITKIGDLGVTMFFIASSYTLFNSYKNRIAIDGKSAKLFFFIRRFFRIAPLYYIAGLFYTVIVYIHPMWVKAPIDPINILVNFIFLNGIYLPAINYIPPGGWSVGAEMLFYLTIPFLFTHIKRLRTALVFLIGAIIASYIIQIALYFIITTHTMYSWHELRGSQLYFWFPNQFPVFCFGIVLFFVVQTRIDYKEWMLMAALTIILLLSFINYQISFPEFLIQREYLYSVGFLIFAFSLSKTSFKFMIKPINKLGQVSFSAYLIHFIIVVVIAKVFKLIVKDHISNDVSFVIVFGLVVMTTYFLSRQTYKIEKFGISVGENWIDKIKYKQQASAQLQGKV